MENQSAFIFRDYVCRVVRVHENRHGVANVIRLSLTLCYSVPFKLRFIKLIQEGVRKPEVVLIESAGASGGVLEHLIRTSDYIVYSDILNAVDYGIHQNRKSLYYVAIRKDKAVNDFSFPEPVVLEKHVEDILEPASAIPAEMYVNRADLVMNGKAETESNNQVYRQFGNSVVVDVTQYILLSVADVIEEHKGNIATDDSALKSEYSTPVEKIFSGAVRRVIRFGWSLVYSKLLSFYSNFRKNIRVPLQ